MSKFTFALFTFLAGAVHGAEPPVYLPVQAPPVMLPTLPPPQAPPAVQLPSNRPVVRADAVNGQPGLRQAPAGQVVRGPAPFDHDHVCRYDGTRWNHRENPSHNCPKCGRPEYVQSPMQARPQPVFRLQSAIPAEGCPPSG